MKSFEERCRSLTEIAYHHINDFAMVASAAELEVAGAADAVYRKHVSLGSGLWAVIGTGVVKGVNSAEDVAKIARILASQTVATAEKVLSAACIVLAHSVADDCCLFAIDCDPSGWAAEIDLDRKVTLRELKEKGASAVFEQELQKLAAQLRGKSLPSRADALFRRVPIVQNKSAAKSDPDYFSLKTLKELDDLRHDIVHRGGVSRLDVTLTTNRV